METHVPKVSRNAPLDETCRPVSSILLGNSWKAGRTREPGEPVTGKLLSRTRGSPIFRRNRQSNGFLTNNASSDRTWSRLGQPFDFSGRRRSDEEYTTDVSFVVMIEFPILEFLR